MEWHHILEKRLSPKRLAHSVSVAETAATLYPKEEQRVYLAGLLHDYCKEVSGEELLQTAREHALPLTDVEILFPSLLHGPVAASLLANEGINDAEVLAAIANHTVGAPGMSAFERVIFVADAIEPLRNYPGADMLRTLAKENFDKAFREVLRNKMQYVLQSNHYFHPGSISVWNWCINTHIGGA